MTANTASVIVPVTAGETILQQETREIRTTQGGNVYD